MAQESTTEVIEGISTVTAWGAVSSPLWLPTLHEISQLAALLLPILGALWLITQIGVKLYVTFRPRRQTDKEAQNER